MLKIEARAKRLKNREDPNWELHNLSIDGVNELPILIEGESGSGKTSILRFLMGDSSIETEESFLSYAVGDRSFSVESAKNSQLIGYVGTDHPFLNWCSIEKSFHLLSKCFNKTIEVDDSFIASSLAFLNLNRDHLLKKPYQLSFGERRRLSILFSASMKPAILLIDEVFNGLDDANCRLISDFLLDPERLSRTMVVMTAHEPRLLAERRIMRFAVDTTGSLGENRICEFRQLAS